MKNQENKIASQTPLGTRIISNIAITASTLFIILFLLVEFIIRPLTHDKIKDILQDFNPSYDLLTATLAYLIFIFFLLTLIFAILMHKGKKYANYITGILFIIPFIITTTRIVVYKALYYQDTIWTSILFLIGILCFLAPTIFKKKQKTELH